MTEDLSSNGCSPHVKQEPTHSDQLPSRKSLANRHRKAARKAAELTKESPAGRANAQSSKEKASENDNHTKPEMNGNSFPKPLMYETLQENTKLVNSMTPVHQSSVSTEVGKAARSAVSPSTITELNDFIQRPSPQGNVAAVNNTDKDREEKATPKGQEQQPVPTAIEVTSVLPSSLPEVSASSSVSYAEVAKSPPKKTTKSTEPSPDAPPQPKVVCESPATGAVVKQLLDNLYVMIRQQRLNLLSGPMITIHVGNLEVAGISKRLVMACCSVLSKHFAKFPESLEYRFAQGSIDPDAIRHLLVTWAKDMSQAFEIYAVPMQGSFAKDVALLRASRLLGMEPYTKHMLGSYVRYLKESLPSYEEIDIVEQNATSEKDPLWTHMVNHLCHDRHKKLIPDPEYFADFLEDHPRLKKAMEDADSFFASVAKKNWEERKAVWEAHEAEQRARWEQKENETRVRIAKEKESVSSLRKKMEAKGGSGLLMATAEEAAFLRNR